MCNFLEHEGKMVVQFYGRIQHVLDVSIDGKRGIVAGMTKQAHGESRIHFCAEAGRGVIVTQGMRRKI